MNHLRLCLPLQATYEHGFVTMEESQQRIVGELQHRHQQDLQRLQLDTDRLLEEETAATITGEGGQCVCVCVCLKVKRF